MFFFMEWTEDFWFRSSFRFQSCFLVQETILLLWFKCLCQKIKEKELLNNISMTQSIKSAHTLSKALVNKRKKKLKFISLFTQGYFFSLQSELLSAWETLKQFLIWWVLWHQMRLGTFFHACFIICWSSIRRRQKR